MSVLPSRTWIELYSQLWANQWQACHSTYAYRRNQRLTSGCTPFALHCAIGNTTYLFLLLWPQFLVRMDKTCVKLRNTDDLRD
jgi:hypothetical protein